MNPSVRPRAAILGCAGPALAEGEWDFFAEADPFGFILFARNCDIPAQVRDLVAALRASVGREEAPVLIDQEGGRVARLKPPSWREAPSARAFGVLAERRLDDARRAVWLNARLIAADLADLGITVDCAPVADLALPETHAVIGDRAFAEDPALVATLCQAFCDGLLAGGVLPVIKHIPGHGRARADSHLELPIVDASLETLRMTDFAAFKALAGQPWAMTAHVKYSAIDAEFPATTSSSIIRDVIRGEIGFLGVLVSDDLGMRALDGTFETRAEGALAAGCDIVLHCSGVLQEMHEVIAATPRINAETAARIAAAESKRKARQPFDSQSARAELDALLQAS